MSFLPTVFVIHLLALMSPGPDFLIVSRTAVTSSRRATFMTALGVAAGVMVWAALALLGLHLLLQRIAWLQNAIQIAGGAYLVFLGFKLFKASFSKTDAHENNVNEMVFNEKSAFRAGLLTNLANPKAAIYFASILANFITDATSNADKIAFFAMISVESLVWFSLVGALFSLPAPRAFYRRAQHAIDRVAGTAFAAFGLHLILMQRH